MVHRCQYLFLGKSDLIVRKLPFIRDGNGSISVCGRLFRLFVKLRWTSGAHEALGLAEVGSSAPFWKVEDLMHG